jgi:hypothetical protein
MLHLSPERGGTCCGSGGIVEVGAPLAILVPVAIDNVSDATVLDGVLVLWWPSTSCGVTGASRTWLESAMLMAIAKFAGAMTAA